MKTIVKLLLVLSLTPIIGCSNSDNAESILSKHSQLFQDPSLKPDWNTVAAAVHTNGYVVAETSLRKLGSKNKNLTLEQVTAIQDTLQALNTKLYAAAARGDLQASNAIVELQKMSP
jgi:hypothetical protein